MALDWFFFNYCSRVVPHSSLVTVARVGSLRLPGGYYRWVLPLWHPLGHASNVRVLHRIPTVRKQRPLLRDTPGTLKLSCCSSDMVAGEAAIHGTGLLVISLLRGISFRIPMNRKCKAQVSQTSVIQVRLQSQSRKGVSEALGPSERLSILL
jgi:hypothetical protein